MKIKRRNHRTNVGLIVLAISVASFGVGGTIYAQGQTDKVIRNQVIEEKRKEAQEKAEQAKLRAEERVSESKQRLEGKKLEKCQEREGRIEATMSHMTERGEGHIAVFTKIADRVKAFAVEKGKNVENYEALVADVDAKKVAAEASIVSAKSVSEVFSCDSDNPKIASDQFRDAHKAQVAALKDYRTAVKNLIVAVKAAQSSAHTTGGTEGEAHE